MSLSEQEDENHRREVHLPPEIWTREVFAKWLDPVRDRLRVLLVCWDWERWGWEGFDPGMNDNRAIWWISRGGHLEAVERLLQDPRVDPGVRNNFAILCACANNHLEIVKCLLKHPRVDPTVDDNRAIWIANSRGFRRIAKHLLEDPRMRNSLTPGEIAKYE